MVGAGNGAAAAGASRTVTRARARVCVGMRACDPSGKSPHSFLPHPQCHGPPVLQRERERERDLATSPFFFPFRPPSPTLLLLPIH